MLADRVVVAPYTLVANSRIETGAQVGPFARLRMDAQVGPDARVGNFVELKKTQLGKGAKSQHLAYLGDSEIGAGSNIGAGTITCNYDGEQKHRTHHRRARVYRQQFDAGGAGRDRAGQLCGRGQRHHRRCSAGSAGAGARAAGGEAGLGEEQKPQVNATAYLLFFAWTSGERSPGSPCRYRRRKYSGR